MSAARQTPYQGLVPYSEDDASFFFGREREQEIIITNLKISRLTLLYGSSGVGKSSVLRAGVVHRLRELGQRNAARRGVPLFVVTPFSMWRDEPLTGIQKAVADCVSRALGGKVEAPPAAIVHRDVSEHSRKDQRVIVP